MSRMAIAAGPHLRWITRADMPAVLDIERRSFADPSTEDDFFIVLRKRNCIGMLVELRGRLLDPSKTVAFMIYELRKTAIHVLRFAVDPEFRRRGIGRAMVAMLVGKLHEQRRTRIVLEVSAMNTGAQRFFRAVGFRATGVLKAFYGDPPRDSYRMVYRLHAAESVNTT